MCLICRTSRLAGGSLDFLFCRPAPGSPYVPNLLLEILISSPQKPKTKSDSSRHHFPICRPRHDKRCPRCLNLRGRLAARSRAAVAARHRPIVIVSNVGGEGRRPAAGSRTFTALLADLISFLVQIASLAFVFHRSIGQGFAARLRAPSILSYQANVSGVGRRPAAGMRTLNCLVRSLVSFYPLEQ